MGIPELDLMFDVLDTGLTGYLTTLQLSEFFQDVYFIHLDRNQLEGALQTICGNNHDNRCPREHFLAVLQELERRKSLEDKIYWDFRALDFEGNSRISIDSTSFLFKAVHEEKFSLKTWNNFVQQRFDPSSDVSFDEVKIFLCNIPVGGPCDDDEFLQERDEVNRRHAEDGYNTVKELRDLQADDASLAADEREKQDKANKLKHEANRRTRRLDHEGVEALLHDDEDWDEESARKARQRVSASELIHALKKKYQHLRETLLKEMLKNHVGEGMWTALSTQEQNERTTQLAVKVKKLRKEGKLDANSASTLPGSGTILPVNMMALMGNSRFGALRLHKEEEKLRGLMKEKDKSDIEIEEAVKSLREEAFKGTMTTDMMLIELERRYADDKDYLSKRLRGTDGHTMATEERLVEYALLIREELRGKQESHYLAAGYSVGLAEELHQNLTGQDRTRQEKLSLERLIQRKGRKLQKDVLSDETISKGDLGVVDLTEDVVKLSERKQAIEREMLIYMLQGRDSTKSRSYARKITADERTNQLLVLKMQRQAWKERSTADKLSSRDHHRAILQEAVGLVFENRRHEMKELGGTTVDDIQIATAILSELQESQDIQSRLISSLPNKDVQELRRLRTEEDQSITEEWLDNLSAVILGTEEGRGQEDELLKALEDKYDALRDKLLLEALEKQLGAAEWARLSERERQARLLQMKLQEKRLRQQGKFDEAAALLGEGLKNAELLQSLLGENRQRYMDRLKDRLARRQQRMEEGLDPDEEDEETMRMLEEEESKSTGNILKDLQNRFDDEKDALLRRLREEQDRFLAEKRRQAELARLRREKRQAEQEEKFGSAALVLGLAERNRQSLEERLKRDRERQEQLARERLANRKGRRGKTDDEPDDPEPDKDDIAGWQDALLKSVERKHRTEQELLMGLLLDETSEDLRQEARDSGEENRLKQIQELKDKRDELDFGVKADQETHEDILDMAAAYRVEIRRSKMTSEREVTNEDVHTSLMADLQEEQGKEIEKIMSDLQDKIQSELASLRQSHIQARQDGAAENVATILLRYEGPGTDDQILSALDSKYDALKDKLLLEALKKQLGDAEWAALSERERQQRLMKLKLEERRLRKEGNLDELARLLGEGLAMDANLKKLLGDNKARYEEKLKERLARRRERLAQGLPPDDSEDEDEEEEESDKATTVIDVLNALDKRYDDEKDALMAKLQGDNERFLSERQRQAELARLRREKLKAKQEDRFDSAALVLGLAERNQAAAAERLNQDRLRQEQLARDRLAQRRKRRTEDKQIEDKLITDGDVTTMQENILKILENKYKHEREVLTDLLQEEQTDFVKTVEQWTQEQCEERLRELKEKLSSVDEGDKEQRKEILLEAAAVKFVNRQKHLQKSREGDGTVPRDDVIISLLADLQQEQDKESETIIGDMQAKDKPQLIELQKHHTEARQGEALKNVVTIVTRSEEVSSADDGELVQALEDKYDALRDKLIADALMKQVGEQEWKAMSERDRMAKLVQMKLEAKRLKKEGKIDDLQKIFGDSLANEANLASLMGENKASYEKRLQERLAKRRERLEQGMEQQEVDKLEAEEDKQFEEEIQKDSTGNALLDLEKRFEEEKEALLAGLQGADEKFHSERERQAELARLRRDERRARQEDTFDKAAMVFGLAQAMQANLADVRRRDQERQKELARQRLEARRNRTKSDLDKEKLKLLDAEQSEECVTDPTNIAALQDGVVKEMELKHACERQVFEIILSEEKTSDMRKATQALTLEQMNDRLFELKQLRKQWRECSPDEMAETADEEELHLREATGLRMEIKMAETKQEGEEVGEKLEEEIAVSLLAELQQQQDQEEEFLLQDLASKTSTTLQQIQQVQLLARKQKWYDNIAATVLGVKRTPMASSSQAPSEDELVEALEEKYDALKDKLLAEALMKQMGQAEWAALSERERQSRLVKLKIQEKRLREEGKLDEASRLLGEGQKHEASLRNMMGQSKARQQDAIKERLLKLKKMKEAGEVVNEEELATLEMIEERGIENVDSAVIESITDETMTDGDEVTTANLIHDLQSRYEEEKEALLASLRGQDARLQSERMRQLELAKLRREQKRFKIQDNFDTAAILFGLAKKQEATRDTNYKEDRSRQEQLARDRIAALKARRAAKNKPSNEDEEKSQVKDAIIKEIITDLEADKLKAVEIDQGGISALQESILNELEQKHTSEQQVLADLLQGLEEDTDGIAAAKYLSSDERLAKINQMEKDRQSWRMDSMRDALKSVPESQQDEAERKTYASRIVESRSRQKRLLHEALLLRVESRKQLLVDQGVAEDTVDDEVAVGLLADLQEKQLSENTAMNKVLGEKEKEVLDQIKDDQRRARREEWCDNVAATILGARPVRKRSTIMKPSSEMNDLGEEEEEHAIMEEEHEQQLAELEQEMEKEKQAKTLAGASEEDIKAAMAELQRQHEARRTAMQNDIERQRRLARERLEARRRKRDEQQYEEDVAASIVTMAEKQFAMVREKTMLKRDEAKDTLKDRLARRRLERQKQKDKDEQQRNEEEEKADKNKEGVPEWPLPPGFSMKREKTVIEVDLSEEKQREIVSSLIREHTSVGKKFERERTRHEDMIKKRRNKKKEKREQKEEEALFILGLGERQKTFVEQQKKDERERQITMIRDRITRVRYERTQTMKEPSDPNAPKGFTSFQDDEDDEGLSQDEKMKRIAAKMEEKFKTEQKTRKSSVQVLSPPVLSPDGSSVETSEDEGREVSHNLLDEKGREKKLKERMASRRRKSRQHNEPILPTSAEGAEGGS